ncbi:MAG: DinB family protein [Planctomycetota bacterium]|nr:DinB family protein [Planctomycetota bacterium]
MMSTLETYQESFAFNRTRTLALLDSISEMESPAEVLGWRPGAGRAHIAWQLMHIGVTEELFGVERLVSRPEAARHADLWERFRGGSTPDDTIPSVDEIRQVLSDGRELMSETLASLSDDQLETLTWMHPRMQKELSLRTTLQIVGWHEGHHQGQAHITLNLYRACQT